MANPKLTAKKRKTLGRKVKTLRKEGLLPANVFGKKIKSYAIELPLSDFAKVFESAGETTIIDLSVEGLKKSAAVLVSNVQHHPVTDRIIHVDFHEVDLKEKVTAPVAIVIKGESPADKSGIGIFVQLINEVEVEALPADLPESVEVDISGLKEVDAAVYAKDLKYDTKKITISLDPESIIAKVEALQKEEEPEPVETPEGEEGAEETLEGGDKPEEKTEEKKEDSEAPSA